MEEEVFENERFARNASGAQWGAANLRSREDPRRFQYALQQADSFPQVQGAAPGGREMGHQGQVAFGRSGGPRRSLGEEVHCAHMRS